MQNFKNILVSIQKPCCEPGVVGEHKLTLRSEDERVSALFGPGYSIDVLYKYCLL